MSEGHVHEWTGPTGVHFRQVESAQGTYYHETTPEAVRRVLDEALASQQRIRIFMGDTKTGRCWGDEWHTIGRVGRSMGPVKIPLLIERSTSPGGMAILDNSIIGIQSAPNVWLYKHPELCLGLYEPCPPREKDRPDGYVEAAQRDGELVAQFRKAGQAKRWCKFMSGLAWGW